MAKFSAGYVFDFLTASWARSGAGLYASLSEVDSELEFVYGKTPWSFGVFLRLTLE